MTGDDRRIDDMESDDELTSQAAMPHSGATYKILGETAAPEGSAILAHNTAGSGTAYGLQGVTDSPDGTAIRALTEADFGGRGLVVDAPNGATGANISAAGLGMKVTAESEDAVQAITDQARRAAGVYGINNATTNPDRPAAGVQGATYGAALNSSGVLGQAEAGSGETFGVRGLTKSDDTDAAGVFGQTDNPSKRVHGVRGRTASPATDAAGVYGRATADSGETAGVLGKTASEAVGAAGVRGVATDPYGNGRGVEGVAKGSNGVGVSAKAPEGGLALFANATSGNAITANAPVTVNSTTDTDELSVQNHGMLAYLSSNQSIPSGSTEAVVFDSVKRDDFSAYSPSGGAYQVPADGDYVVEWQIEWQGAFSNDPVRYELRVDFTTAAPGFSVLTDANGSVVQNFSKPIYDATEGDQIDVTVIQSSGSSKDIVGQSRHNTFLSIRKVG